MELSDLAVFKQVAECGGITRAAEKLNRVPSNVTARIQKLEEELGKALFIREKNRLTISASGQQLLVYATDILNLADQARLQLQNQEPSGQLRIGAMEAVMATRLVQPLQHYHAQFPEVELSVKASPTGVLIEDILQGTLDLALVADPATDIRLQQVPVFNEKLVLVSSLSHCPIKTPKDLGHAPTVLGFNHKCAYRNRLTQWLQQGGSIPKIMEINSYHTLLSCVAAGMGVGMVPLALLETYPFAESLQVHHLAKKWSQTSTTAIWRNEANSPAITQFVQGLLA